MTRLALCLAAIVSVGSADTRYEIDLSFEPGAKVFEGTERVTFKNDSPSAIDEVPFRLDLYRTGRETGWMTLGEVKDPQGTKLDLQYFKDRSGKELGEFPAAKLASPLAPGGELTLTVSFQGGVATETQTFWADDNDRGTTGSFFPRLILRRGGEWAREEWTPAEFRVSITAPENYKFVTTGKQVSVEKQEEGQAKTTFESKGMRGFGIIADPTIVETSADAGGVEVRVASFGPQPEAPRVIAMAKEALEALTADLGRYPHARLCFFVTDKTQEMEVAHGLCVLPRNSLDGDERLAPAVAYAVARAWWGEEVSDPGAFPRWLTSGCALVSAEGFLAKRLPGVRFGEQWVKEYTDAALLGLDTTMAQPVKTLWSAQFAWDRIISRGKGYAVLRLFSHLFPKPSLPERMKAILSEHRGDIVSSETLVEQCPEVERAAAKEFFRTWVMTDYELDYVVAGVEAHGAKSVVKVARKGNATAPVEVEGTTPDGKTARATWDGLGEEGEVTLDLPREGLRVRLDPDRWLPCIDRSHDVWFPRPKRGPDVGTVSFKLDGKPQRTLRGDALRWRDRLHLEASPGAPLDLGLMIEVTDADHAVSRTPFIARGAAAGKPVEADFELAGPAGKNTVRVRVYAASSEAELVWAAGEEKPLWEGTHDEEPAADLGGAKVGAVAWGGQNAGQVTAPLTLSGTGAARVWFECRASAPGFPEGLRWGKAFDVQRGKESTLELEGIWVRQEGQVEWELAIGTLSAGEERPRPEELLWSKRRVTGR